MPQTQRIAFLGDSLTAGYGVGKNQAFPSLVCQALEREHQVSLELINAGVSGDTSADGVRRVHAVLRQKPHFVVVALGANDMLRGVDPAVVESNLRKILQEVKKAEAQPVLLGMQSIPFHGIEYLERFDAIFPRLGRELELPLLPFFIKDVAGYPEFNQGDGIHPNELGQERIAATVLDFLLPVVRVGCPGEAEATRTL